MTNFNENILSKIIARRIIAPEDRANMLPLATPIYCPDANGVKASRVTIIDPNANTLFTSDDFLSIGSQFTKGVNNQLVAVGTPVINTDGIYTGSSTNFYRINTITNKAVLTFDDTVARGDTLLTFAETDVKAVRNGKLKTIVITKTAAAEYKVEQEYDRYSSSMTLNDTASFTANLVGEFDIDFTQSTVDGVKLFGIDIPKQPGTVKNTVDIDLTEQLTVKYFIPNEVELETNIDLVNFLKADYAVKFKHEVSTKIHDQVQALVTGNLIPKITMGTTLAETLGTVITKLITTGTGQKYSIYKYNNGAPIEYINRNNQPSIDKVIMNKPDNVETDFVTPYATIDDINIPGLYYFEKPSLILDNAKFEDYQQGLCGGSIKKYVEEKLNVDTTADTMTNIGEGIFGTNDCFAVAFTQPSIQRKPSQDMFGDELYIAIYYGVKLVSKINLGVIE